MRVHVLLLLVTFRVTWSQATYDDARSNYETILNSYQSNNYQITDVIPTSNYPVVVNIGMKLTAVMEYDAVNARLQLIGSIPIEWKDESQLLSLSKGLPNAGTLDSIFVSYGQIWTPNLMLVNEAETISSIGDASYKVRFNISSSLCSWNPRVIINAECAPDMTYFPFDKQYCELIVRPTLHNQDKMQLQALSYTWDTSRLEESGSWEITWTSINVHLVNDKYEVVMGITIKRKPLFFSMVIVLPTLLLSLLSGFVFLLPSASGERVGFGVTCFLSFIVLLQSIMNMLPEVSSPMSLLCYYVIVMLLFSGVLNIVNILLMRLHLNPTKGKVPTYLVYFFELITCKIWNRCCKCRNQKVNATSETRDHFKSTGDKIVKTKFRRTNPNAAKYDESQKDKKLGTVAKHINTVASNANDNDSKPEDSQSSSEQSGVHSDIDWPTAGKLFDWFFLFVFCGVQVVFTVFFLVPLAEQYTV